MSLEIKKFKVDITYHKIIDGVVEEITIGDNIYRLVKSELKPEKQNIKKRISKKPKDSLEFSETYKIWITEDTVKKVMQAINHVELNYIPVFESIHKQSGLTISKCRAALQYLCKKGTIKGKRDRKTRIVIYR